MKLKKMLKNYKDKNTGQDKKCYNFYLELANGQNVAIKPAINTDKRGYYLLLAVAEEIINEK